MGAFISLDIPVIPASAPVEVQNELERRSRNFRVFLKAMNGKICPCCAAIAMLDRSISTSCSFGWPDDDGRHRAAGTCNSPWKIVRGGGGNMRLFRTFRRVNARAAALA